MILMFMSLSSITFDIAITQDDNFLFRDALSANLPK